MFVKLLLCPENKSFTLRTKNSKLKVLKTRKVLLDNPFISLALQP